ncbi:MAG TPA: NUDIX domain-containing protein [Steroidobacter sp.]|nr:NUDIX domain-containing protein [Steroidobacter sp.]
MARRKLRAAVRSVVRLSNGFLKVNRYEFETDKHDGGVHIVVREVMERGHAVGVLGYDPKREEVALVSEFRPGCFVAGDDPYAANLVAGGIADGETACEAAVREMKEEADLDLRDPLVIHPGAYVSSGGTSEKVTIVVGVIDTTHAGGVHGRASESEDALTIVLPAADFIARVRGGEIADLKTLVAGYWLAENRQRFHTL